MLIDQAIVILAQLLFYHVVVTYLFTVPVVLLTEKTYKVKIRTQKKFFWVQALSAIMAAGLVLIELMLQRGNAFGWFQWVTALLWGIDIVLAYFIVWKRHIFQTKSPT